MEILQNLKDWTSSSTCLVSIFINFFLSNSVKTFNWNSDGGRIYSERCASLHFCVRWPCFGARFLGTLIWSRPRERERERVWRLRAVWSVITHRDFSERAKSIAQTSNPPGEWKVCAGIPNKHKDGSNTDMTPRISLEVDIQIHDREEGRQTVGCNICLAW